MKARLKSIGLAMACAFAASTASAASATAPEWKGTAKDTAGNIDNSWWNIENWYWGKISEDKDAPEYTPETFPATLDSATFNGEKINFWSESATTINLGGSEAPIQITGSLVDAYDGRSERWVSEEEPDKITYDGGPITLTNGTIVVNKSLQVGSGRWNENVGTRLSGLVLKDVNLTCNENIEILYGYQNVGYGNGRVTIEDGTSVSAVEMKMGVMDNSGDDLAASTAEFVMNGGEATFSSFTCTCSKDITATISLNAGELSIPGFSKQWNTLQLLLRLLSMVALLSRQAMSTATLSFRRG